MSICVQVWIDDVEMKACVARLFFSAPCLSSLLVISKQTDDKNKMFIDKQCCKIATCYVIFNHSVVLLNSVLIMRALLQVIGMCFCGHDASSYRKFSASIHNSATATFKIHYRLTYCWSLMKYRLLICQPFPRFSRHLKGFFF